MEIIVLIYNHIWASCRLPQLPLPLSLYFTDTTQTHKTFPSLSCSLFLSLPLSIFHRDTQNISLSLSLSLSFSLSLFPPLSLFVCAFGFAGSPCVGCCWGVSAVWICSGRILVRRTLLEAFSEGERIWWDVWVYVGGGGWDLFLFACCSLLLFPPLLILIVNVAR